MLLSESKFTDIWSGELSIPIPALDVVIFTIIDNKISVVLLEKQDGGDTFYLLPGGILASGYSLEDNFDHILESKTGIKDVYKEQLYTFGEPSRDKRGHTLSISYFALVAYEKLIRSCDFDRVSIVPFLDLSKHNVGSNDLQIGTDHFDIISYAYQRIKWKFEYTNVAKEILPQSFRLTQLREVYEIVLGMEIDKRNFNKKILKIDLLEETGAFDTSTKRPSKLYSFQNNDIKIFNIL